MKKELIIQIEEFDSINELSQNEQELLQTARNVTAKAYAPYSEFRVGAALLLQSGRIVTGTNQENAAYPSGLCAERVAIYSAGSNYPDDAVVTLAISADSDKVNINQPIAPCGGCRQTIAEYEKRGNHPIRILFSGITGKVLAVNSIRDLLPLLFEGDFLKKS